MALGSHRRHYQAAPAVVSRRPLALAFELHPQVWAPCVSFLEHRGWERGRAGEATDKEARSSEF